MHALPFKGAGSEEEPTLTLSHDMGMRAYCLSPRCLETPGQSKITRQQENKERVPL